MNKEIIGKEIGISPINAGISAPDVAALKDYLKSITFNGLSLDKWAKNHKETKCVVLKIRLNCGCIRDFEWLPDIPDTSVKCKHGNYFILYDTDRKEVKVACENRIEREK